MFSALSKDTYLVSTRVKESALTATLVLPTTVVFADFILYFKKALLIYFAIPLMFHFFLICALKESFRVGKEQQWRKKLPWCDWESPYLLLETILDV
jgi:hypothetical protein